MFRQHSGTDTTIYALPHNKVMTLRSSALMNQKDRELTADLLLIAQMHLLFVACNPPIPNASVSETLQHYASECVRLRALLMSADR